MLVLAVRLHTQEGILSGKCRLCETGRQACTLRPSASNECYRQEPRDSALEVAFRGHDGTTDSTAIAPLTFKDCQHVEAQKLPTHLGGDVDNPLSTVVQVGLVGGELGGLGEQGLQVGNGCGTCSICGPSGIPSQSYHSHHRHLLPYVPG